MKDMSELIISPEETAEEVRHFAELSEKSISVILGAGASFGYSKNFETSLPPTVELLFSDDNAIVKEIISQKKHSFIKGQRLHITRAIKRFNADLEAYLSDLYAKDSENNMFSHLLLYLQDIFSLASENVDLDDNNYQNLINILADWRGKKAWSLLSFNYDSILEQSFLSTPRFIPRRNFTTQDDYTRRYPKILKMHGGVDFRYIIQQPYADPELSLHEMFSTMMDDESCDESILSPGTKMPSLENSFAGSNGPTTEYNFPLMMIPIHGSLNPKNSLFRKQIEIAKKEISHSSLVIAIGYKFGDEIFTRALKNMGPNESELILVGSSKLLIQTTDHPSYKSAAKIWPENKIHIFGGEGFGQFIEALYL